MFEGIKAEMKERENGTREQGDMKGLEGRMEERGGRRKGLQDREWGESERIKGE